MTIEVPVGRKFIFAFAALFAITLLGACSKGADSEEALMQAGLDALYTRRDPIEAAAQFRQVLEQNPNHYGATYQLASALDAAGKQDEAHPLWEKVLQMAEESNDKPTADTARTRLTQQP